MALRKEQVVLIGTVAVLGLLAWQKLSGPPASRTTSRVSNPPEFQSHPAPDLARALPLPRKLEPGARDLFSPPSDTRPLPLLELQPPPLIALPSLRPPPSPGPAPAQFSKLLRTQATVTPIADLFDVADDGGDDAESEAATAANNSAPTALTPEEQAARLASWKKLYDWVRIGDYRFGQIRNPDRYNLAKRAGEDVLFVEFNPEKGTAKFPNQAPAPIPRATVTEFDFAATIPNQIEIRRAQFANPLLASEYDAALAFADWCLEQRHATPRALEVAEEMYTRASKVLAEDPAPRLGLARVFEAGFQFERAFELYNALLEGGMQRNPAVLARLAQLEAKFRLFEQAEAHLREAERFGRTSWIAQAALGRFLLERGRPREAVAHLGLANNVEPQGAEHKRTRALLRADLGAAYLAAGELDAGREWFDKALQADPSEPRALAGLLSAAATAGTPAATTATASASLDGTAGSASFELALAQGYERLAVGTPESLRAARRVVEQAAAADPLRAHQAWRALSWLAETTGHPDEALRYVDLTLENDPEDVWGLYQRGRLLAGRDDLEGAAEALRAALALEIDLPDVLAALGEIAHRRGDFASAERYLERALQIDPALTGAAALRGVVLLELGALRDAEVVFKRLLALDPDHPVARNGLAWCLYRAGDAVSAQTALAELDDNRRALADDDVHRVWARTQIARIADHLEKQIWSDHFERNTPGLGLQWDKQETNGPLVSLRDGVATISGAFKQEGRARMWQQRIASEFVSLTATLTVREGTNARVGIFVAREQQRGGDTTVDAEVTLSRHPDNAKNAVQTRSMKRNEENLEYSDVPNFDWKIGQKVILRIERVTVLGEKAPDPRVTLSLDGIPVLVNARTTGLNTTNNPLRIGIFAEGQVGRQVHVDIDDVEIVQRRNTK